MARALNTYIAMCIIGGVLTITSSFDGGVPIAVSREEQLELLIENTLQFPEPKMSNTLPQALEQPPRYAMLNVPYIHESPDMRWTGPWKNGCEEASVAMVHFFIQGTRPSVTDSMRFMQTLFDAQDERYGSNADSDVVRTAWMVDTFTDATAYIVEEPTIEDIRNAIREGNPVIVPHHGFSLGNKHIPFLATGSSYHMTVVVGYDDATNEFIVHDTGDPKAGAGYRYTHDVFMRSIHDFSFAERRADGPARVIIAHIPHPSID